MKCIDQGCDEVITDDSPAIKEHYHVDLVSERLEADVSGLRYTQMTVRPEDLDLC